MSSPNQITVLKVKPLSLKKATKKINAFIQAQEQQRQMMDESLAADSSSSSSSPSSSALTDTYSHLQQLNRLKIPDHIMFQLQQIVKSNES